MKPPYFKLTAYCDNDACATDTWQIIRKHLKRRNTGGQETVQSRAVCPECGMHGFISDWEEVTS